MGEQGPKLFTHADYLRGMLTHLQGLMEPEEEAIREAIRVLEEEKPIPEPIDPTPGAERAARKILLHVHQFSEPDHPLNVKWIDGRVPEIAAIIEEHTRAGGKHICPDCQGDEEE